MTETQGSGYFNPNPRFGRLASETPGSGYFNPNHGFGRHETETTGSGLKNAWNSGYKSPLPSSHDKWIVFTISGYITSLPKVQGKKFVIKTIYPFGPPSSEQPSQLQWGSQEEPLLLFKKGHFSVYFWKQNFWFFKGRKPKTDLLKRSIWMRIVSTLTFCSEAAG